MSSVALKSGAPIKSAPALGLELTAPRTVEIVPGMSVSVHEFEKLRESPTGQNQLLTTVLETVLTSDLIRALEKKNSHRSRDLIEQDCRVAAFKIFSQFDPLQGDSLYKYVGSLVYLKVLSLWREEGFAGERRLWSLRRKISAINNEVSLSGGPALTTPELAFRLGIAANSLTTWQRGLRLMKAVHLSSTGRPAAHRDSRLVNSNPAARHIGRFDDTDSEYSDLASRLRVRGPGPSTLAEHADLQSSILSLLKPRERRVIMMTVDGYSDAEIATDLSLSEPSVSLIRSRARRRIIASGLPHLSEEERTIIEKIAKMRKDTPQNREKISSESDHMDAVLRVRFTEARFPGVPLRQHHLREYVVGLLADAASGMPVPMPTNEHLMNRFSLSLRRVRSAVKALTPEQQEELSALRVRRLDEEILRGRAVLARAIRRALKKREVDQWLVIPTNRDYAKKLGIPISAVAEVVQSLPSKLQERLEFFRRGQNSRSTTYISKVTKCREYLSSLLAEVRQKNGAEIASPHQLGKRFHLSGKAVSRIIATEWSPSERKLYAKLLRQRGIDEAQQARSKEKNYKLVQFLTEEASRLARGLPLTHSNRATLQELFNVGRARLNDVISKLPEPDRSALVKAFLEGRRVKTKMVGRYAEVTKWLQTEWKEYSAGKRSTVLSISAVAEQFKLKPAQIKRCLSVAFHDSPETIGNREKVVKKQWRGRPARSAQTPAITDSPKCSD